MPELEGVVHTATAVRDAALAHSADRDRLRGRPRLIVANAALAPRPLTVLLPGQEGDATLTAPGGRRCQPSRGGGLLVHDPARVVPDSVG